MKKKKNTTWGMKKLAGEKKNQGFQNLPRTLKLAKTNSNIPKKPT